MMNSKYLLAGFFVVFAYACDSSEPPSGRGSAALAQGSAQSGGAANSGDDDVIDGGAAPGEDQAAIDGGAAGNGGEDPTPVACPPYMPTCPAGSEVADLDGDGCALECKPIS